MNEKILLVDDEVAILEGYQRLLHREFQLDVAVGGKGALAIFEANGPYSVVVSDMRMPEMDGGQLLAKIKVMSPDTIRVMLTGNADIQTAVIAVNEGSIFRFLTKPCTKETLAKALTASLLQGRMITAEKELLEKTLRGSIQVLAEVLSLVNPAAFGRSMRLRRYIQHISKNLCLSNPWRFEVAAMMSQLGCVTIAPQTIDAVYAGEKLSPEEQVSYDSHPSVARDLLSSIPRMEPIAWMIANQNQIPPLDGDIADRERVDMRLGAKILRVAIDYDDLLHRLGSRMEALHRIKQKHKDLDQRIVQALFDAEYSSEEVEKQSCAIANLSVGMILAEDIRNSAGALMAPKGHEITLALILKLKNLLAVSAIKGAASIVVTQSAAAGTASGAS
jgi:CheY-like chemotaxis protein